MLNFYCLPGKIFAHIGYLWPGKGELWASGRRRDSRFAHFVYATVFWTVLAFVGFALLSGPDRSARRTTVQPAGAVDQPSESISNDSGVGTSLNASEDGTSALADVPSEHEATILRGAPQTRAVQEASTAEQPPQQPDLLSSSAVQDAAHDAFLSGKAVRWHDDKLRGYAVPSEPAASGCRTIAISNDDASEATVQTTICE